MDPESGEGRPASALTIMAFQWTHPHWLWLGLVAIPWMVWWHMRTDHVMAKWKRHLILALRLIITLLILLGLAGLQWLRPMEGMNVVYLLDRSESLSADQKQQALSYVQRTMPKMKPGDHAGVVVFGEEAALELRVLPQNALPQIQSVLNTSRTDLEAAIRLGTAAFPESGQKRIILLSDGNENLGDGLAALRSALPMDVSMDVYPMGSTAGGDLSIQRIELPSSVKEATQFEVQVFAQSDEAQSATLRLFINDELVGEDSVDLEEGKNLFTLNQDLPSAGFYTYEVQLVAQQDAVAQNNRAMGFVTVQGNPRVLLLSGAPEADQSLIQALRSAQLEIVTQRSNGLPEQLPELQSYDTIILSNVAAGDMSNAQLRLLQSAIRDFGVGLICIGGDQSFAAGGYRGTPLEESLPVDMELTSQKVLPNGALVMVMHGMEFNNGNQIARQVATGVMHTMAAQDELGIVLWDGTEKWLFELQQVEDKAWMGSQIMGMNQGDLPSFQNIMSMAFDGLKASTAQIKHIILFSDGDPGPPTQGLMDEMVANKVTVSSILISGHAGPETMQWIAQNGNGRFYEVRDPNQLPQVFMKEAAVILKTAIIEHPFQPELTMNSEPVRGLGTDGFPILRGYVGSSAKPRAEVPLVSDQGDPILAHWQYGLGRTVAFTSDATAKWAQDWVSWPQFQAFWSQLTRWSLRRMDRSNLSADIHMDKGLGTLHVEAIDTNGQYRNFLDLRATVVSPSGQSLPVRLEQTSPGHYQSSFPAREVGAYTVQLGEYVEDQLTSAQVIGSSINFSPEYENRQANLPFLSQLAQESQGQLIDPSDLEDDPFDRNRKKTFRAEDGWPMLLMGAILLFPLDVGIRRIQLEAGWVTALWQWILKTLGWPQGQSHPKAQNPAMEALLKRRDATRSSRIQQAPQEETRRPSAAKNPIPKSTSPSQVTSGSPPKKTTQHASSMQETDAPTSTTSRLLAAKRKKQQKPPND